MKHKLPVLPFIAVILSVCIGLPLFGLDLEAAGIIPPDIHAGSAAVLDIDTGSMLYEKDGDAQIPPASLAKLVTIYISCSLVEEGKISLSDRVNVSVNAWAAKLPGSSLMFLEPGQRVTVEELLRGLAIVSGNDAAIALAEHISGSVKAFAELMNNTMQELGFENLHFVDSSGLDGRSSITAREFAQFCRIYLKRFPDNLKKYHSVKDMSYPLAQNMPTAWKTSTRTIHQYNRNGLLGAIDGVDGLKTGFVVESGYNFALTAVNGDMRLIVVTLGGPGDTAAEGSRLREEDGLKLIAYGFDTFTYYLPQPPKVLPVKVWKGKSREIRLTAEDPGKIIVPKQLLDNIAVKITQKAEVSAPVMKGEELGTITYESAGIPLLNVALTASDDVGEGGFFTRLFQSIALSWENTFDKDRPLTFSY